MTEPKRAVIGGGMMKVTKVDDVEAALASDANIERIMKRYGQANKLQVFSALKHLSNAYEAALRSAREEIERKDAALKAFLGKATP